MSPEQKFLKYLRDPRLELFTMYDRSHVSQNPSMTEG
jgi:hypothetical protein